ncbi:HAMP domain-containing histidine kinase [Mediterraneibacter glycyrrhizinilyticus]|nr:HAMP domain-containing sensor histidine kinase [Mediterraneibacter glycyrrhizinilyticus]MBM6854003.1 HAMP domain-containing histidine kinase [Mediterraneibacter glycyrrhizinilyticus]
MKSLFKIIRRYISSTILLVVFVVLLNILALSYVALQYEEGLNKMEGTSSTSASRQMEDIASQLTETPEGWRISQQGIDILNKNQYIWGMLLDENGDAVWEWQLPEGLPRSYSLADVASFSRWYLNDYPVRVWEYGKGLLVLGQDPERFFRVILVFNNVYLDALYQYIVIFFVLNSVLIFVLALWFGYRFYRSLRPIARGVDALAESRPVLLSEKGITEELARKLNQTSRILERQSEKLRQRDNARTEWISGVSHDIRTPLALITGYAEALASEEDLSPEDHQRAESIRRQSLIIRQLISDLNLTSKLEYNSQPLHMEEYRPAVLLREIAADYYNEGLQECYEIDVKVSEEAEQLRLTGDTGLLKRALRNLIGNSIRHNPEGCRISAVLFSDSGNVVWRFSDTGPGIPKAVIDVLLGRSSENSSLHIMGLRIVIQIISAHGGRVLFPRNGDGAYGVEFLLPEKPNEGGPQSSADNG